MSNQSFLPNDVLFHTKDTEEALHILKSRDEGLSNDEVLERQQVFGENKLIEEKKKTILGRFIEQFKDLMVIILMIAAVVSGIMDEWTDSIIILAVVLINAVLGVIQESKAEKSLDKLKQMSTPNVKVKREGVIREIPTEELVPGDIVSIEAGNIVPADMRLLESATLKIEEAALTGEAVPVEKDISKLEEINLVIGDRKNMVYSSSIAAYGRGTGLVTHTGMSTEVGKIATHLIQSESPKTPLHLKLEEMSKYLSIGIVVISIFIFIVGILRGREYFEMFLTSVSLAVAAIPEGLLAVITIVLSIGVQKMARRNAIIKKLAAVETLGSTQIICSDKTGTLTLNRMTVKQVYLDGSLKSTEDMDIEQTRTEKFLQFMVLCNDTSIKKDGEKLQIIGDPTEAALTQLALDKGIQKDHTESLYPREDEIPFDSDRKLMTTFHSVNDEFLIITKGAPEVLLKKCGEILINGDMKAMTKEYMDEIEESNKKMADGALRVLAIAIRNISDMPEQINPDNIEKDLLFIGLIGMMDPPRKEAKEAVLTCKKAGIRPIMITGDHRNTAYAIAKEIKIVENDNEVITGKELNTLSDRDFENKVTQYNVYARVSPEHKVKIVSAWKKQGKIVAMTGDGVNDAPALKSSDIGVGMGITGTDVTKSVANMVLADDNFATIVVAVEEGRKIYSNIQKAIQFLLSSNLGEIITLFLATMFNWTILYPIHILWVNLVTDTLPALALGAEKAEEDVMNQPPRPPGSSFFSDGIGLRMLYQGVLKGLITLIVFYIGIRFYTQGIGMTMAFATLGLIQLTDILNVRSKRESLFKIGLFSNLYLIGAIAISAILQVLVIIIPFFNRIFKLVPLNTTQWMIVIGASFVIIPIIEIIKVIDRNMSSSNGALN
ncbi:MAG: cation-translocating P-type ATPase [Clostridia bacterium]|nr:cation-translocating P-type ATPase [Clostridia bacterium]